MRCLYCGKELALLKRLTGSGEFCSESHKQNYQEEYNRLALSRLLQAQSRSEEVRAVTPPVEVPVVVEPVVVEPVVVEPVVVEPVVPEPAIQSEPEPPAAGFVVESLEIRSVPPAGVASVVSEGPLDMAVHPVIPAAELAAERYDMDVAPPETGLLALSTLQPRSRPIPSPDTHAVNPREFPTPSFAMDGRVSAPPPRGIASAGLTAFPVDALTPPAPVSWDYMRAPSFASALGFEQSMRLDFRGAALELPAADGPAVAMLETAPRPVAEWTEPESPKLALEALTRMQREIAGEPDPEPPRRNGASSDGGLLVNTATLERAFAPRRDRPPAIPSVPEPAAPVASARSEAVAPAGVAAAIAIPLDIAPPPKPQPLAAFEAVTLPILTPRLPRVDTLPLRPKIVHGAPPQESTTPDLRQPLTAVRVSVVSPALQTGPAPAARPATSTAPPVAVSKAATPPVSRPPQTRPPKSAPAAKPSVSTRAPEPPRTKPTKPASSPAPKPQAAKPRLEPSPELLDQPPVSVALKEAAGYEIPNLAYSANASFWRSGKNIVILVVALLLALGIVLFLNSGPHKSTAAGAATGDGVGPSIMMGEGGWITDWAGDARGQNRGRHITMYRPSLTLSDYRIVFQARIESKSAGWVFRAANPDSYYVMKIQQSGPGRLELAKFLVINGSQRQLSAVQLPADIHPDALLSVRVDVRGPHFSTFVQDRPVDIWTDDQLRSGGVGFLNDRGERAHIQSVQISYLSGAAR